MSARLLPVIRVFVSSTFSDFRQERDWLQQSVFPELERYCLDRQFQFQAIDLRWGVPGEAGLDHRTMRICFEELRAPSRFRHSPISSFSWAIVPVGGLCRKKSRRLSSRRSRPKRLQQANR